MFYTSTRIVYHFLSGRVQIVLALLVCLYANCTDDALRIHSAGVFVIFLRLC